MPQRIDQMSARMAAGDTGAVDAFYREYFGLMYAQARRFTHRDESFCLDVVQDAVLRVIRTVKAVKEEARFRGWLRLVIQTTAYDLLRSETRRKNREAMAGASQLQVSSDSLQLDWLREQIARLDPEIVHLIELRFTRSWSLRQIGESLGLSIGSVDGRLRRALQNLQLAAEDPPTPAPDRPQVRAHVPAVVEHKAISPLETELVELRSPAYARPQADHELHPQTLLIEDCPAEQLSVVELEPAVELRSAVVFPMTETANVEPVEAPILVLIGLHDEAAAHDDRL